MAVGSNVEILNRAAYTPRVCLHDVLSLMDTEQVERILIMVQTSDGAVQTFTSHMSVASISYLAKCLDRRVYNLIEGSAVR